MSYANLFGALIFGCIGLTVFLVGKKRTNYKLLIIGIILMAYPYFVSNTVALYAIGAILTLALFIYH
ncbi:MAG: hypothetical protein V1701_12250 [Planctomycetota bacterium]